MGILLDGSKSESSSSSNDTLSHGDHDRGVYMLMTRIEDITPEEEREFEAAAIAAARSRPPPVVHHPSQPQVSQVNTNISETHPLPMQMPPAGAPGSAPTPPAALEDTAHTTEEYMTICRSFIEQLRSGSAPWLLQRLNNTYGTMPDDPSEFSYWMALVRLLTSSSFLPSFCEGSTILVSTLVFSSNFADR
jgi:hypothetical protein